MPWSIKEVLGHLLDSERIFTYRALRFARNTITDLPGFDQNAYVRFGNLETRTLQDMLNELIALRRSNVVFFRSFSDEALRRSGTAYGRYVTVRTLPFVMVGHVAHHIGIIRDKYGIG
ncbi:MAG: DinB family protein [candidate division Zixibacteria bacterium]|nr:DinB family protein [candidate division Zixibacteria bacterium]